MRRLSLLLVSTLVLSLAVLATISAPAADNINAVKLVAQLGSSDFEEREAAASALEAMGAQALDALRQGLQSEDPEVRMRSGLLVKKLETRIASASLLAGKRVRLVYQNKPLTEALADFNKQSGYTITLQDPQGTLKDRTITLDTGDVTFWQALDKFCDAAGLTEDNPFSQQFGQPGIGRPIIRRQIQVVPVQVAPAPPADAPQKPGNPERQLRDDAKPTEKKKVEELPQVEAEKKLEDKPAEKVPATAPQPRQGVQQIQPAQPAQPQVVAKAQVVVIQAQPAIAPAPIPMQINPGQGIVLRDGKGTLPTDASSSIRVRALDRNDFFGQNEKEILLALQVTPEPRLHCQVLPHVKITKAIDENGQNLAAIDPETELNLPPNPPGFQPVPRPGRLGRPVVRQQLPMENIFPVRLKAGNQPSKTIKELRGVITAQVQGEAQPIITVDEILKAAGKTFKGGDNGVIRVLEVKKQDDGQVEIRFEFEAPRDVITVGSITPVPPSQPQPAQPALQVRPLVRVQPVPQPAVPQLAPQPLQPAPQPPQVAPQPPQPAPVANHGFTLLDDKGNSLPLLNVISTNRNDARGGVITEYRMTFRSAKTEPARLVFMGQHTVTVEVPFTLKDVNVP